MPKELEREGNTKLQREPEFADTTLEDKLNTDNINMIGKPSPKFQNRERKDKKRKMKKKKKRQRENRDKNATLHHKKDMTL